MLVKWRRTVVLDDGWQEYKRHRERCDGCNSSAVDYPLDGTYVWSCVTGRALLDSYNPSLGEEAKRRWPDLF